jgi:hypothetical protein
VRGGREIEEEVGRVLRSLHSREKRDVRTRVLQALIACTREREREESLAPRSWGVAERGVSEGRERLSG